MSLKAAFAPLVDLVYPPRCPMCGEGISQQNGLCLSCWNSLVIPGEPACRSCQRPLDVAGAEPAKLLCGPCLAAQPRHDGITAATLYNDASRRLILTFKHGRKIALAPMLARLIASRLPKLEGEWLVVPVPLHRGRLWQRGFNQSALLAREIARIAAQPLAVDALERRKPTPSLGGLGRVERARTLRGAIAVNPACKQRLRGAQALLVDDVVTSGATTETCLAALRKAGAVKVRIACFARVLDEAL